MTYYYLAASLPALSLDAAPPVSVERFRQMCAEWLDPADLAALDAVLSPAAGPARHAFVRDWTLRTAQLRNAIARARAARLQRDPAPYLKDGALDPAAERAVADAFGRPTPLDRELALDRFRWHQADELTGFDPFSLRAILAYAVKLRLAARWAALSEEDGRTRSNRILEQPARTPASQKTPAAVGR